jgi:Domain of unknown function (DUF4217)
VKLDALRLQKHQEHDDEDAFGLASHHVQLDLERCLLQRETEEEMQQSEELSELARKGFVSSVRAYATHSIDTRHIFQMRRLHLGHLAKSFALRDTPSNLVC